MPTVWENSHVDRLFGPKSKVQRIADDVRRAIEPLILPDAAKVLAAIATDVLTNVQKRNNRADVNDACAALRDALEVLEGVGTNLDG